MTAGVKGSWDFYEYPNTLRHMEPETVTILGNLHDVRLTQDQAIELTTTLRGTFDLPWVQFWFVSRTDRAWYFHGHKAIKIRPSDISTEILCHELAHHWVAAKMVGSADRTHGFDFAIRLEKLAIEAARLIEEA